MARLGEEGGEDVTEARVAVRAVQIEGRHEGQWVPFGSVRDEADGSSGSRRPPRWATSGVRLQFDATGNPPEIALPRGWVWETAEWQLAQQGNGHSWQYRSMSNTRHQVWTRFCHGPAAALDSLDADTIWLKDELENQLTESAAAEPGHGQYAGLSPAEKLRVMQGFGDSEDEDDDDAEQCHSRAAQISDIMTVRDFLLEATSQVHETQGGDDDQLLPALLRSYSSNFPSASPLADAPAISRQSSVAEAASPLADDLERSFSSYRDGREPDDFVQVDHPEPKPVNILILTIGSRGDIQPFVALSKRLQQYGHRVRLAGFEVFRSFVEGQGIEFFPLAGDPVALMKLCVDNSFFSLNFIYEGIVNFRGFYKRLLDTCWRACIEDSPDGSKFCPDAIIANPPVTAHVHLAEKLDVPLVIGFTMPWTRSGAFPHPMMSEHNWGSQLFNKASFDILEYTTWLGFGDVINRWRKKTLELKPLSQSEGAFALRIRQVPHFYAYSEGLVPKPADWPEYCRVTNYWFLEESKTTQSWQPPADLEAFLAIEPKPLYIGFGSIPADDAEALTKLILKARAETGVRLIIAGGWSGLGQAEGFDVDPKDCHFLSSCPHDWLFPRCAAVIHHGGAGTVAAGLNAGCPTGIVSFFGDQFFWARVVKEQGVGMCTTAKDLNEKWLKKVFVELPTEKYAAAARRLGEQIRTQNGVDMATDMFNKLLPLDWATRTEFEYIFEYQTWQPFSWGQALFGKSYKRARPLHSMEEIQPLRHGWAWQEHTGWEVDHDAEPKGDADGWVYSQQIGGSSFHSSKSLLDTHRRRRWKREKLRGQGRCDCKTCSAASQSEPQH